MRTLIVAPNHLGDGVMALPTVAAISALGPTEVRGPRWVGDLYRDLRLASVQHPEVAVLLAPSLRAAWSVRSVPRRIGVPSDARGWLLTDAVTPAPRVPETYRALAERVGARVDGLPTYAVRDEDPEVPVPLDHVGLNPISVSGAVRQWSGWEALAERIGAPVVFYGGPGEEAAVAARAGRFPVRAGLSLPAFARALRRCRVFLSNDSGAAHFAAACGVRVLTVHGSTSAHGTGPAGSIAVRGPALACAPCHGRTCARGDHACLDVAVDDVWDALNGVLGA
ncbi:MAG: glycosyltransferase family 9 protein [Alphaproteobacteria bacterium]|nr:glycosyltransferase family 9 protein [Alphaproteobacteria bacterium]MCB9697859.1 glycosyltransferase family 9 protein [Alphaproteobacteria bacterium]